MQYDDVAAQRLANYVASIEFASNLWASDNEALRYLKSRGVTATMATAFGLGYAIDGWRSLSDHYLKKLMEPAGVVTKGKQGNTYDRFRSRLMFPIHDEDGRVVGFGARGLTAATKPKYLNSPSSDIYDKSSILYNLHRAAPAIREAGRVYVVEGYMDVIRLWQIGVENVVGACGTAFTKNHARVLLTYAPQIDILFDGDAAGAEAVLRSGADLALAGIKCNVLTLPDGDDPDSYIAEGALPAWRELQQTRLPFMRHVLKAAAALAAAAAPCNVADMARIYRETYALLESHPDDVERVVYLTEFGKMLPGFPDHLEVRQRFAGGPSARRS